MPENGTELIVVWIQHALKELEKNSHCTADIKKELTLIKIEIAKLKVKSGLWGAAAGAIPSIALFVMWVLKNG